MMTAGDRECELPAADSCAIMEGEDAEDDLIYLSKKSFFTKIKSFSREVRRSQDRHQFVSTINSIAIFLMDAIQWGDKYLIPCWFCMFSHWQTNDQSIILMVGLFEQWETE